MDIGSILTGVGDIGNMVGGFINSYRQNKTNEANYQLQENTFRYQQRLQNQIFQREDSAHQREVADLKAAGLNPILSAGGGGAGAGQAISIDTPQKEVAPIPKLDFKSPDFQMAMLEMGKDFAKKDAEIDLLKAQINSTDVETALKKRELNTQVEEDTSRSTPSLIRNITSGGRILREIGKRYISRVANAVDRQKFRDKIKTRVSNENTAREYLRQKEKNKTWNKKIK